MTDLNSVVVAGRITRDCESGNGSFCYLQNGTAVAKVSIAVNRSKKNADGTWSDEASFFNVTIFGKLAESILPRLRKGVLIGVSGSLKQDRWQKDGQNYSQISIVADSVQIFTPKPQSAGGDFVPQNIQSLTNNNQQNYQHPQNNYQQRPQDNYQQNVPQQNIPKPPMPQGEMFTEDLPWTQDNEIPF